MSTSHVCAGLLVCMLVFACSPKDKDVEMNMTQNLSILGNLVFFYYPDLNEADRRIREVLNQK